MWASRMKSELPVSADALLAERARLEEELQANEDWRELLRLKSRKDRGEPMSAVNTARLELVLIDALSQDPTFIRYKAVCVALERLIRGLPPFPQEKPAEVQPEDDLTQIRGITPSMARRLKALDVMSFAQIAGWRRDDIQYISAELDIGRQITDQKWVAQAARLVASQAEAAADDFEPETEPEPMPEPSRRPAFVERRGDAAARSKSAKPGPQPSERRSGPVLVSRAPPEPDWGEDDDGVAADEAAEPVALADEGGDAFLDAVDAKAKGRGRSRLRDALADLRPPLIDGAAREDVSADAAMRASEFERVPDPEAAPHAKAERSDADDVPLAAPLDAAPEPPASGLDASEPVAVVPVIDATLGPDNAGHGDEEMPVADAHSEVSAGIETAPTDEVSAVVLHPVAAAEALSGAAPDDAASDVSLDVPEGGFAAVPSEPQEELHADPLRPLPTPPKPKAIYAYPPPVSPVGEPVAPAETGADATVSSFDASGLTPPEPLRVTREMISDLSSQEAGGQEPEAAPASDMADDLADEKSLAVRLAQATASETTTPDQDLADVQAEAAHSGAVAEALSAEPSMSISEALAYAAEVAQRGGAVAETEPVEAQEPPPPPPVAPKPPPSTVRYEPPKSPRATPPRRMTPEPRRPSPPNGGLELPAPPPLPADYVARSTQENDAMAAPTANGGSSASHDVGFSKVEIEEATVEIVRKGLAVAPSPKMVLRAPEREAPAGNGEEPRSATPIGRFLKALTGNQS